MVLKKNEVVEILIIHHLYLVSNRLVVAEQKLYSGMKMTRGFTVNTGTCS